jgi:hypothetical protein
MVHGILLGKVLAFIAESSRGMAHMTMSHRVTAAVKGLLRSRSEKANSRCKIAKYRPEIELEEVELNLIANS